MFAINLQSLFDCRNIPFGQYIFQSKISDAACFAISPILKVADAFEVPEIDYYGINWEPKNRF